jgi:hypothetical protein
MPYTSGGETAREEAAARPTDVGELTYAITELMVAYVDRAGGKDYALLRETQGAAEAAALEFWWRVVRPYEDLKREFNLPDPYERIL